MWPRPLPSVVSEAQLELLNMNRLLAITKRILAATPRPHAGREEGQALVLTALLIIILILFVGLGVDIGHLMARRAKLQSAVDASALSAAQMLVSTAQTNPRIKAEQMMEANGIPLGSMAHTLIVEEYAGLFQVKVGATQRVETFFMRMLPGFEIVNVYAEATADLSTYAEINAKPYGQPGVVNELNLMVWGRESHRRHGDAYSPEYDSMNGSRQNPHYPDMPYGYLFRIDVPANFPGNDLVIEAFDPDTYNRDGDPPLWDPTITNNANRDPWQFVNCFNPSPERCNSDSGVRVNTGLHLEAFPDGKPAFWRVDEYRYFYNEASSGGVHDTAHATDTFFEVWHFDPYITTVFADPNDLSDAGGAIDTYRIRDEPTTDLRWVRILDIPNFRQYAQEDNGKWYFYLYVQGEDGSSENNYDLRVGPPQYLDCDTYTANHCDVNRLYRDLNYSSSFRQTLADNGYCLGADGDDDDDEGGACVGGDDDDEGGDSGTYFLWKDGGAQVFAKRALPLNLITGDRFPVHLTQIPREAAGQTLGIRHFDMDCNGTCGSTMNYQMQVCGCEDTNSNSCWRNVGVGYIGGNNLWIYGPGGPDPELVQIPSEDDASYTTFFGSGANTCNTSLLRMEQYPSFSEDTTVWEIPFIRPRLIR